MSGEEDEGSVVTGPVNMNDVDDNSNTATSVQSLKMVELDDSESEDGNSEDKGETSDGEESDFEDIVSDGDEVVDLTSEAEEVQDDQSDESVDEVDYLEEMMIWDAEMDDSELVLKMVEGGAAWDLAEYLARAWWAAPAGWAGEEWVASVDQLETHYSIRAVEVEEGEGGQEEFMEEVRGRLEEANPGASQVGVWCLAKALWFELLECKLELRGPGGEGLQGGMKEVGKELGEEVVGDEGKGEVVDGQDRGAAVKEGSKVVEGGGSCTEVENNEKELKENDEISPNNKLEQSRDNLVCKEESCCVAERMVWEEEEATGGESSVRRWEFTPRRGARRLDVSLEEQVLVKDAREGMESCKEDVMVEEEGEGVMARMEEEIMRWEKEMDSVNQGEDMANSDVTPKAVVLEKREGPNIVSWLKKQQLMTVNDNLKKMLGIEQVKEEEAKPGDVPGMKEEEVSVAEPARPVPNRRVRAARCEVCGEGGMVLREVGGLVACLSCTRHQQTVYTSISSAKNPRRK